MAKKTKRSGKKVGKKSAKKTRAKAGPKKLGGRPAQKKAKPARKAPARARGGAAKREAARPNPFPIGTGSAPPAAEVGKQLVDMFNRGEFKAIEDALWAPEIVSVEGMGMGWRGRKAVDAKNAEWNRTHRIHGGSAEGPFTGATGFAVKFDLDIEDTATGKRTMFEEVGVYKVRNGKIVEEEFMYGRMTPVGGGPGETPGQSG